MIENKSEIDINNIDSLKEYLINMSKHIALNVILSQYDYSKQICVNELQGYIQKDKDNMWIYINNVRDWQNNKELEINDINDIEILKKYTLEYDNG